MLMLAYGETPASLLAKPAEQLRRLRNDTLTTITIVSIKGYAITAVRTS